MADGLFLSTARAIAKEYPDVTFDAELLDNTCLRVWPLKNKENTYLRLSLIQLRIMTV
jgi:hypothetical protein